METKRIRVGIAGFGMSGEIFQAPFLNADPHFEIKRVYERTTERCKAEYPQVEVVRSFEELLTEDIDLVVVSTPNAQHYPMARQALEAGKNVIVEKPVAATSAEAEDLVRIAREKGVLLSVYQSRRLDGDFLTVKQLIEEGALGEVLDYEVHYDRYVTAPSSKPWKAEGGKGVNILFDLGVHIIDQAYTLFGMPEEVYADFRKLREGPQAFDAFEVVLYYGNLKAVLGAGEVVVKPGPHFRVNGRKGTFIKYGMDVQENALIAGKRPPSEDWGLEAEACYGTLSVAVDGRVEERPVPTVRGNYGQFYENIHAVLTAGAELRVKPEETVAVLRILEAAEVSHAEKRRVRL